jgi:transposase
MPYKRSTEMFRKEIFRSHKDGISQKQLKEHRKIGSATIERWFRDMLELKERMFSSRICPRVLGIDEHFFSKKDGYVTTFCDLENQIFDLAKGRSEKSLAGALRKLKGRDRVKIVCIDLSVTYRSIVKKYFPNARLESWQEEIVRMWRFTRNNEITEGFHTKMELIQRKAYGFRNFENYRLRVIVLCS